MTADPEIDLAGERMALLPERAMFWSRAMTLFVADTHWGKDAAFRAASIAVPGGVLADDLARLSCAIERTHARRLIILGDLLHAKKGRAPATLSTIAAWREQHADLEILLVRGNHDQGAGDPPDEWRFVCVDAPSELAPFVLQHEPAESRAGYALGGHIHPAVRLNGLGRQSVQLPCFWFGRRVGVLPAFGGFTGCATVAPRQSDQVFVVVEGEIMQVG